MKTGRDFNDFVQEVQRNAEHREDVVAKVNNCRLATDKTGASTWNIGGLGEFDATPVFHDDVATTLRIPTGYYDDMRRTYPALLDANVNAWIKATPDDEYRFMRLFDASHDESGRGTARAIRSTSYLPLDDADLLDTLRPVMEQKGIIIQSCELTDKRTFLKLTTPRLKGDVKVGDAVEGGLLISNSEVGHGRIVVAPFIHRLVCTNGMVAMTGEGDSMKRMHKGAAIRTRNAYAKVVPSHERRQAAAAVWRAVGEAVGRALEGATFQDLLTRFQDADKARIKGDGEKLFKHLGTRFNLTDAEQTAALVNFETDDERTLWGAANAVTKVANHTATTYERASFLEEVGGLIVQLPESERRRLVELN